MTNVKQTLLATFIASLMLFSTSSAEELSTYDVLRASCLGGQPDKCGDLGDFFLTGGGEDLPDIFGAVKWYRIGCKKKDATSCVKMGESRYLGRGIQKDPERGFGCYKKACEYGDKKACKMVKNSPDGKTLGSID